MPLAEGQIQPASLIYVWEQRHGACAPPSFAGMVVLRIGCKTLKCIRSTCLKGPFWKGAFMLPIDGRACPAQNITAVANQLNRTARSFDPCHHRFGTSLIASAGYTGPLYGNLPAFLFGLVRPGMRLNQIRFRTCHLSDAELITLHETQKIGIN